MNMMWNQFQTLLLNYSATEQCAIATMSTEKSTGIVEVRFKSAPTTAHSLTRRFGMCADLEELELG
jgi:hypothetical protein